MTLASHQSVPETLGMGHTGRITDDGGALAVDFREPVTFSLTVTFDLAQEIRQMFAGYGLGTEEGVIRALRLWRYLASAAGRGQIVALLDPQDPDGDYR